MKTMLSLLATAALVLSGCSQQTSLDPEMKATFEQQRAFDTWAYNAVHESVVTAAVLEQPVIYPYHFTSDSDSLTELGQQRVALLADHYKSATGQLVLMRGNTPEALYTRRRDAVMTAIRQAGVAADHVALQETLTAGGGITGQSIAESRRDKEAGYTGDGGSVSTKSNGK